MKTWRVLRDVGDLLFPRICVACHMPLLQHEQIICLKCRVTLPRTDFGAWPDNPVAKKFWGKIPVEGAVAMLHFHKGSKVQSMMHALKYRNRKDVGVLLGNFLGNYIRQHQLFTRADCISTVPLHADKLAIRGYNQCDVIAEGVQQILQLPILNHALVRKQFTSTQTKKSRLERWENVREVFEVSEPDLVIHKHILLIDDVITTGSTLEACAMQLIAQPHTKVSIAAVAYAEQ
ncbi:MAG TPA: ComF family protein [Chitinophagales bacterium]|nr:ComF family protein [Chitinophagales bacterium]